MSVWCYTNYTDIVSEHIRIGISGYVRVLVSSAAPHFINGYTGYPQIFLDDCVQRYGCRQYSGFESFIYTIENTYVAEEHLNEKGNVDYETLKPVLFEFPSFKEISVKEIGNITSFTHTSIYNYFQMKEGIFLALLKREYEL